jgi:hypothetical protein
VTAEGENDSVQAEQRGGYSWTDWAAEGYRGPPPWRRGFRPLFFLISLALVVGLATVFWLAAAGRLP